MKAYPLCPVSSADIYCAKDEKPLPTRGNLAPAVYKEKTLIIAGSRKLKLPGYQGPYAQTKKAR